MLLHSHGRLLILATVLSLAPPAAWAGQNPAATAAQTQADDGTIRLLLPPITVTAEKVPENIVDAPVSVTAVTKEVLDAAAVRIVSDAADYAPNTFFTEFSARKLSAPRFRGIGASPNNPGVATYIDGVPQFNANSSSIELLDVDQIEFVRGAQSPLFGRNSIGGLINIQSAQPSLERWGGSVAGPVGNFSTADVRGSAAGPLKSNRLGLGVSFGYNRREGFTENDVTGHDLDSRSGTFGKAHLLWVPNNRWLARVIFSAERDRDGDYSLGDLGGLRSNPFHVSRDYEGFTHRDVMAPTVLLQYASRKIAISSTTGIVHWKTDDSTDLDYTSLPLATRQNAENDTQFTQEVRFASGPDQAIGSSGLVWLRWQAGVFAFTQDYHQDAVNNYSPFVLSPFIPIAVSQQSPLSELDDRGFGVYGQGTFKIRRFDATVGLRGDRESKSARLQTSFAPPIAPASTVNGDQDFSDVSPQFSAAYRLTPEKQLLYFTVARGYKAGGFNAASPVDAEEYGQEHSWNYEGGVKALVGGDRVMITADVFHINWSDLQVNLPNPAVPGQFYIANAAGATSTGGEIQLNARAFAGCDFFGGFGYTHAEFASGSLSSGASVAGNRLPNTPKYTADFGGQYSYTLAPRRSIYGRADVVFRGDFRYDDLNLEGQDAYSITNLRGGFRARQYFVEGWIRNTFDTHYIPVAFAYPGLAPSGFIGEMGAPRTFGARLGVTF